MTTAKMIGALRVTESTSAWHTETNGTPITPVEIPLTAGLYYVSGDNSASDLLLMLYNDFTAIFGDDIIFSVDSSGIVSAAAGGGVDDYTISWALPPSTSGGAAEYVQAWLKFDTTMELVQNPATVPVYGSSCHAYGFYPAQYLQVDLEEFHPRGAQLVPDSGNSQVVKVARRSQYRVKVRSTGYPRSNTDNEYHALADFHDHATSGRPFRLYPDTSTTTAVYSSTNRYGYQTMQVIPEIWAPQPLQGNWYKYFEWEFTAHQYT